MELSRSPLCIFQLCGVSSLPKRAPFHTCKAPVSKAIPTGAWEDSSLSGGNSSAQGSGYRWAMVWLLTELGSIASQSPGAQDTAQCAHTQDLSCLCPGHLPPPLSWSPPPHLQGISSSALTSQPCHGLQRPLAQVPKGQLGHLCPRHSTHAAVLLLISS